MYYIAIRRGQDVEYIYRPTAPTIGGEIRYNGGAWVVVGYIPVDYFK